MDNGWEAYGSVDYAYREKMMGFSSVVYRDEYIAADSDYKLLNLAMGMRKENWDLNLSITNAANFDGQFTLTYSQAHRTIHTYCSQERFTSK